MRYKIGDVSKILGISPDLLRYYEKKGVVKPVKDQNNDYRYYEPWDINFLIDCLWFKNFGFGLDQVAHMVSSCDLEELTGIMAGKETEIEETIRRQELLLRRARQHIREVSQVKSMIGHCDLVDAPEVYRYLNRFNSQFDRSKPLQELTHQWLEYMPFTHRCFSIQESDLKSAQDNYAWGFSLGMDYVRDLNVPLNEPVVHLPAVPAIHSAFTSSGKGAFSPRHLDFMLDFAEEQGLEVCGSARGNLVCSVLDEEEKLTGYFEVWLPVRPKEGESAQ
jgi:DNA-binding transcriptional MerR regulator